MPKVVQSARNASSIDRFVQKFRDLVPSASRHSSISFALIVAIGLGLMSLTGISGVLFGSSSAHAEDVRYDVNVNSSLTLGFSADTVSLNLNPGSKTFASQDITTTVSTNNQYGYDLYVTSDGTDLINQTDNTKTISTLPAKEGGYSADTFLADKWGVMKNNTSYQPFVSGATVSQSSTVTNADNTVLTFGAKTSYNTAPGNYKLLLTFQLIPRVATNDLTINFGGSGVAEVKVCKIAGDCAGDDLVGRVTANGGLVPGLKDGSTYYLYPVFTSGYEFVSWEKTSDAGTISATDVLNPTFTMTDEPASVTVTGKATEYAITLVKTNATAIVIDGTSYTGSSATLTYGNHTISGTYPSDYEFSSWSTSNSTNLAITSTSSASTTITVHGVATLTLNGKSSKLYIQDFTKAMCSEQASSDAVTVYDKRDENSYTVRYINNNCWMTQNLRFSGSKINSTNTNINTSKTISWGDLTSGNSCDAARYHNSGNTTNGYWYNYAGASAMTITGDYNSVNATYDICPKNWRLPTYSEFSGISSQADAFSPVTGGDYYDGSLYDTGLGNWWSATAYGDTYRYSLYWNSGLGTRRADCNWGYYVRCIRSS